MHYKHDSILVSAPSQHLSHLLDCDVIWNVLGLIPYLNDLPNVGIRYFLFFVHQKLRPNEPILTQATYVPIGT